MDVPDELPGGVPAVGSLVGPLECGDYVVGEVAGEVSALDQRVEVVVHHLSLCTPGCFLLFPGDRQGAAKDPLG